MYLLESFQKLGGAMPQGNSGAGASPVPKRTVPAKYQNNPNIENVPTSQVNKADNVGGAQYNKVNVDPIKQQGTQQRNKSMFFAQNPTAQAQSAGYGYKLNQRDSGRQTSRTVDVGTKNTGFIPQRYNRQTGAQPTVASLMARIENLMAKTGSALPIILNMLASGGGGYLGHKGGKRVDSLLRSMGVNLPEGLLSTMGAGSGAYLGSRATGHQAMRALKDRLFGSHKEGGMPSFTQTPESQSQKGTAGGPQGMDRSGANLTPIEEKIKVDEKSLTPDMSKANANINDMVNKMDMSTNQTDAPTLAALDYIDTMLLKEGGTISSRLMRSPIGKRSNDPSEKLLGALGVGGTGLGAYLLGTDPTVQRTLGLDDLGSNIRGNLNNFTEGIEPATNIISDMVGNGSSLMDILSGMV